MDVGANDVPFRTVLLQNLTVFFFILDQRHMSKTSHCKTQSLSASSCTYLNTC